MGDFYQAKGREHVHGFVAQEELLDRWRVLDSRQRNVEI